MKTLNPIVILSLAGVLAAACGRYEKQPVEDYATLRKNALRTNEQVEADDAARNSTRQKNDQEINDYKKQLQERLKVLDEMIKKGPEKGNDIIVEKVVEKPIETIREQATVDDKFIVITSEPVMPFVETQRGSYQILARSLVKGMKVELSAAGLPEGAKLEKAASENETVKYTLSWTPALYSVPNNSDIKMVSVKLSTKVVEAPEGEKKEALMNLVKQSEVLLVISRLKQAPAQLSVEGLAPEIQSGSLTPFSVTAIVPGLDDKGQARPYLSIYYDGQDYTAGNPQIEQDGSRHVVLDQGHSQAEYLGNYKWKFSMLFDTQKISIQPARGKDRNVLASAPYTAVRLSFKVTNPATMLSSPPILKQLKLKGAGGTP